jgi:excisionase family DNA binding protein
VQLAATLKVNRRTIERRIKDGTLKAFKVVGITLIDDESVKALFEPGE